MSTLTFNADLNLAAANQGKVMRMYRLYGFIVFSSTVLPFGSVNAMDRKGPIADIVSGNTVLVSNKFGPTAIYFDPSGVFKDTSPNGSLSKGTWRATKNSICATTEPTAVGRVFPEFCMDFADRKINESWEIHDPQNGMIRFKLVKGRANK